MKKYFFLLCIFLLFLVVPVDLNAEEKKTEMEPILVHASTKTPVPLKYATEAVTVITKEDIEEQKAKTVADVLRTVPGTDVVRSGSLGGTTSVLLRGAESDHTLVLIDGIEVNSTTTGSFDFSSLTTDNIERIEILRGPQSTLYGSAAMGGVINIITKKGKGKPELSLSFTGGTHETFKENSELSGGWDSGHYSFSFSRTDTDGQFSNDDYKNTDFSGRLGFHITDDLDYDLSVRYSESEFGIQDWGFRYSPDVNRTNEKREFFISNRLGYTIGSWWDHSMRFGIHDDEIKDIDPPEPGSSGDTPRTVISTRVTSLDYQTNLYLPEILHISNVVTFGAGIKRKEGSNDTPVASWGSPFFFDKSFNEKNIFIQNQFKFKNILFFNAGIRADDVSTFGTDVNPKFSGALYIPQTKTKIRGTYAKGFKAPSLNELFYPNYGDPNLKPENSKGYEAGFEQSLFKEKVSGGATYFYTEFDNLIAATDLDGDYVYTATNINEAETEGVEIFLVLNPGSGFRVKANYTHKRSEDITNKTELIRRPNDSLGVNINYNLEQRLNVNLDIKDVGDRLDSGNTKNPGYTKIDLAASLALMKNLKALRIKRFEIFFKGENLLSEKYEEALYFPAPGIMLFGGAKITFF